MALETLIGITDLDGETVVTMDDLRAKFPEKFNESGAMDYKWFEKEIRPHNFIYVRHDVNSLSFTIQNGPVKEVGKNGCQVDHVILAAKAILEGLNKNHPCKENACAITKLEEALHWLDARKKKREKAGVEGFNKAIPTEEIKLTKLKKHDRVSYIAELCPYKAPEQVMNGLNYVKSLGVAFSRSTERRMNGGDSIIIYTTDGEKLRAIEAVFVMEKLFV